MPYLPEHKKEKQAAAAKRYAEAHPERVAAQKKVWYDKDPQLSIDRNRAWKKANPDGDFNARLKRVYGISREIYDQMIIDQGGLCAICRDPPTGKHRNGPAKRLDVDHDHNTGRVRGLLCHPCNLLLGAARDRVCILREAILYLEITPNDIPK